MDSLPNCKGVRLGRNLHRSLWCIPNFGKLIARLCYGISIFYEPKERILESRALITSMQKDAQIERNSAFLIELSLLGMVIAIVAILVYYVRKNK